ncbi:hypothetical protein ABEF95_008339 [Exophiala dermatitidis]|uniref:Zn(2)-C6 fungal-type domain-containing protein n=1 Tax=Exophiala dermatitidis (strain ATCC 34100 / CBS 525.76 / NIH/UT8656) TaxID=858893 RepID=H6C0N8_EXODN|nr:uncharacterized protein HMPREF1120_05324 [Exophiala dermatitidis NIH/UT8656]XP_009157742.1 hypothetical protein, variant [Exophiala dermatitidis NIH/UT8656]EHY57280.1 hypothetical protein, variant [Exophiala dermatitidis NIH/UT8656]EHY57281.1 hypothetical protein HMPREF1120_05324 [Exophiala dermatitidis NIH/UT8656]
MISTRLYNPDIEFFRRNDRGFGMPLTQHPHQDQYETGSHISSRTTPSSEIEQRAISGSRKRVPVACDRCRKRKIKCSGNEGNNQSCQNCRNSGHGETCRFLRVSSVETSAFGFRGWQGPSSRYSPYSLPAHHRLNYVPMASRYSPPGALQYPAVPTSVDYGSYANPSTNVDWARTPYVPSYPPYPDEEEASSFPSQVQPPPYILPNTDPMSSTNAYYMHAQGVRPHHASVWTEPQQCMPQANPQLTSPAYAATPHAAPPLQTMGMIGNPPSDRILPTPISARNVLSASINHPGENTSTSGSGLHASTYWTGETGTNTSHHQSSASLDSTGAAQHPSSSERSNSASSYRMHDMSTYSHMGIADSLATASIAHGLSVPVNDLQCSTASTGTPEASQGGSSNSSTRTASHEHPSLKTRAAATPESLSGSTYDYTDTMAGRSNNNSHLRSAASSGAHPSNSSPVSSLYCRTQQNLVTRARGPAADDCSPDCSSYQSDSARVSVVSMGNQSSGY